MQVVISTQAFVAYADETRAVLTFAGIGGAFTLSAEEATALIGHSPSILENVTDIQLVIESSLPKQADNAEQREGGWL